MILNVNVIDNIKKVNTSRPHLAENSSERKTGNICLPYEFNIRKMSLRNEPTKRVSTITRRSPQNFSDYEFSVRRKYSVRYEDVE